MFKLTNLSIFQLYVLGNAMEQDIQDGTFLDESREQESQDMLTKIKKQIINWVDTSIPFDLKPVQEGIIPEHFTPIQIFSFHKSSKWEQYADHLYNHLGKPYDDENRDYS